ncbi:MAG: sensor histidine kinase [Armatimonadota bacterium]
MDTTSHDCTCDSPAEITTFFAPAERSTPEQVWELAQRALNDPLIEMVLTSADGFALILNEQRQIVAASQDTLAALGLESIDGVIGKRPGELLRCVYAGEGPGGCGTGRHCAACGAVTSLLSSIASGAPSTRECSLAMEGEDSLHSVEFRVRATPAKLGGQNVMIFVMHDISAEKRRAVMERIFFHDVNDALSGLLLWSGLLRDGEVDSSQAATHINKLAEYLSREIQDQHQLLRAERGELEAQPELTDATAILHDLRVFFSHHAIAKRRYFDVECRSDDTQFMVDPVLLLRVLLNMVKNAFEATEPDGTVHCWFERLDGRPAFVVQNAARIPDDVAHHIFQRSFSTKSHHGRGLGTYSMKLFGERYLGGAVSFISTDEDGTKFSIVLPEEN